MLIEWCFYNFGSLFTTFSAFLLRRNGQNQLLAKKQVTFVLLVLFRLLKLEQAQKSLVQVY